MRPAISHHSAKSQRGAVVIMTAGFMLLGVLFLALVVDTGRLYMEKRSLQRIADVVALELASTEWCANGAPAGDATVALNRNIPAGSGIAFKSGWPKCGTTSGGVPRVFTSSPVPEDGNAVQVEVIHSVSKSLVAGGYFSSDPNVDLWAVAVAARSGNPLARLTIRSGVAAVDSTQSVLLNAVLGNLLGSSLSLTFLDWNGLANTNINLLELVGVDGVVGSYESLLTTDVLLADLVLVSADILNRNGDTVAANALGLIGAAVGPLTVNLGDLLGLQTGLPESAADIDLNVLDLVQGAIQLATTDNAVNAGIPVNLPGLGAVIVRAQVAEKPQLSAIGDPREIDGGAGWISSASHEPDVDRGDIFVRTSQIRLLISLQLDGLTGALNTLLGSATLLSPIIDLLTAERTVLGLVGQVLTGVLTTVLGCTGDGFLSCPYASVVYVTAGALDVGLDVGGANAFVSDHNCSGSKTMSAFGASELGRIYVGKIQNDANSGGFFASGSTVNVTPAPLLEIGYKRKKYKTCALLGICSNNSSNIVWEQPNGSSGAESSAKKTVVAGIGVQTGSSGSSLAATPALLNYVDPNLPELDENPAYKGIVLENTVSALSNTLSSLELKAYKSPGGGLLGDVLGTALSTVNNLLPALSQLLSGLAGLLDPLLNDLLRLLGVNLATAEVGANLSCGADSAVKLVY
ncbi:MAG: pilus assembly protein TadG-related protein [Moraxellaceae bacterium]|nr:pilus assembly protein TadG-related protein [Moraxellaceae bacterium]